jgi:hypothetical protein
VLLPFAYKLLHRLYSLFNIPFFLLLFFILAEFMMDSEPEDESPLKGVSKADYG